MLCSLVVISQCIFKRARGVAAAQSSTINEAYKTLSSPLQRAQYILTLQGLSPSETDKLEDRELVMDVMDALEEIESASSVETVEELRSANKSQCAVLVQHSHLTHIIMSPSRESHGASGEDLRTCR